MKFFQNLLACLLVLACYTSVAQTKKEMPLEAKIGVPNGIWNDALHLYVDQTEIANINWLEYCAWLKQNAPEQYAFALPDTTAWGRVGKLNGFIESYTANYYRYDGFKLFPVVGITKAQAEAFCQWRSKIVNENYRRKNLKGIFKTHEVEVIYRLPTEQEWKVIAQANNQDAHGFAPLKAKYKRMYKSTNPYANCQGNTIDSIATKGGLITEYIFTRAPNEQGIYNLIGNVAEMVQEEGVAKGGSWHHTLEASAIQERQTYTTPTAWLGFRCVATIKLTPKKQVR